jgi:hypothetical protein
MSAVLSEESARELDEQLQEQHYEAGLALIRPARECINSLPNWMFTERLAAELMAILSARIGRSNWSHTEQAGIAEEALDTTSDYLRYEAVKQ